MILADILLLCLVHYKTYCGWQEVTTPETLTKLVTEQNSREGQCIVSINLLRMSTLISFSYTYLSTINTYHFGTLGSDACSGDLPVSQYNKLT